jgi:hypothetical protein
MAERLTGFVGCDVHPAPPRMEQLLAFLDDSWCDMMVKRGTDGLELRS